MSIFWNKAFSKVFHFLFYNRFGEPSQHRRRWLAGTATAASAPVKFQQLLVATKHTTAAGLVLECVWVGEYWLVHRYGMYVGGTSHINIRINDDYSESAHLIPELNKSISECQ